LFAVVRQNQTI